MAYPFALVETLSLTDNSWLASFPAVGNAPSSFGFGEPPDAAISDTLSVGAFIRLSHQNHQHCLCLRARTLLIFKKCVSATTLYRVSAKPEHRMFSQIVQDLHMPGQSDAWTQMALSASYLYDGQPYVATAITDFGWTSY